MSERRDVGCDELLAALREIVALQDTFYAKPDRWKAAWARARAAIAKATQSATPEE